MAVRKKKTPSLLVVDQPTVASSRECTACPLGQFGEKFYRHRGIDGIGNPKAPLMIVMPQAGEIESIWHDKDPLALVSSDGIYLRKILSELGIDLHHHVYVTYAARCFNPNFRDKDSTSEAFSKCPPLWLNNDLQTLTPKVVLCLGEGPLKAVTGYTNIMKYRSVFMRQRIGSHSFHVMATYAPDFITNDRRDLESHFKQDIERAYLASKEGIEAWDDSKLKDLDYREIKTIEDLDVLVEEVKTAGLVACDIESRKTDPFDPWDDPPGFPLVSMQFSTRVGSAWFLPIAHQKFVTSANLSGTYWKGLTKKKALRERLTKILANKEIPVIGHNFKFDAKWIKRCLGINPNLRFDTMLAHGLFEETSNSLKRLAWELTDLGGYEEQQNLFTATLEEHQQHDMFIYPYDELVKYGCCDADVTLRAYEHLTRVLEDPKNESLAFVFKEIMVKAHHTFTDIESSGIKIDQEYLKTLDQDLTIYMGTTEQQIRSLVAPEIAELESELLVEATGKSGKTLKNKPLRMSLSSNPHVSRLLYEKLKLTPDVRYNSAKTGDPSTSGAALNSLMLAHPVVEAILDWRGAQKQKSGFVDAYPAFIRPDGKIHPTFSLIRSFDDSSMKESGTRTGRLSCNSPNLHQVPARDEGGKKIKALFVADWDDHVLLNIDYSQIELRVAAMHSLDPVMIEMINKPQSDYHTSVAEKIFGKTEDKALAKIRRHIAKTTNFCILFGGGPQKVSDITHVPVSDATAFVKEYFDLFPQLKEWIAETKLRAQRTRKTVSLFGRIRPIPDADSRNLGKRERALRIAINAPIQSDASDLTLYSLNRVHQYLKKFKHTNPERPSCLKASVHDSILLSVAVSDIDEILQHVKFNILEKPNLPFITETGVVLRSDASWGYNWGNQEDVEFGESP